MVGNAIEVANLPWSERASDESASGCNVAVTTVGNVIEVASLLRNDLAT
jgi:hypothetical protein